MGWLRVLRTFNRRVVFIDEVALDQLDGEATLSHASSADDHQLVFSEKLARVSDRGAKGERRAASTLDAIVSECECECELGAGTRVLQRASERRVVLG